jgi:hypothetical protein
MRAKELISEAKEAPLYHFASTKSFWNILSSDSLISGTGKIYFTRDYSRQFLPHENELMTADSWGIRLDQNKIAQAYGKKLQPAGHNTSYSPQERADWIANPNNADLVTKANNGENVDDGRIYAGHKASAIIRGTTVDKGRWESEEHLNITQLPELHKYITGIVITTRNGFGEQPRATKPQTVIDEIANIFISRFVGKFEMRNAILDYAIKFNIPFVFKRTDVPANALKSRIIEIFKKRKADKEQEESKEKIYFLLYQNKAGGAIALSASSIESAIKQAQDRFPFKFPSGILGYRVDSGPDSGKQVWFDQPVLLKPMAET